MIDSLSDLVDTLAMCAGLAVIVWVGLHVSRQQRLKIGWPSVPVMGMLVWLAVLGAALYLVFR